MMRTISRPDQGTVTVRISSRAGRLLFALLLSQLETLEMHTIATLAGIPKKFLPACIDELKTTQEQPLDPVHEVETPVPAGASDQSITHIDTQKGNTEPLDPEDVVLSACQAADKAKDLKAQVLAVVDAWRLFFPKLAYAEEITRKQDLSTRKAREWITLVEAAFPGREATTVFGWLSGVDEGKLLSMQFPLAWVNKMIEGKAKEEQQKQPEQEEEGETDVMDVWRNYARKQIEKGGKQHGDQNGEASLFRIARAVQQGSGKPT